MNFLETVISEIYAEISDIELALSGTGVLWEQFCFMECNGFDVANLQQDLDFYFKSWKISHPESDFFTNETERQVAIGLRDLARSMCGLPPLSDAEKAEWIFKAPKLRIYKGATGQRSFAKFSKSDILTQAKRVADHIKKHHPDALKFAYLAREYNIAIRNSGQPEWKIVHTHWFSRVISDTEARILGDDCKIPTFELSLALDDIFFPD